MKLFLISVCTVLSILSFEQSFGQAMADPYKAEYSSNFKIGSPAKSNIILNLWKDWDDNAFDRHNYFADTVVMFFSDGSMIKGKDSCLAAAKSFRGSMSSAVSSIQAWIPLKSVDRDQDWVAIWGEEADTYPDGKKEVRSLHEIWRFNKAGKVDYMRQFSSAVKAP
ncbi:MAG: hypothetical protein ABI416_18385 [Ginsengibacter sp.]